MVDMPTSANSFNQRLRNASKEARATSSEPSPKRTRLCKINSSSESLDVKCPLKQSSEENVASFVAKSFYGLKKSQPIASDRSSKSSYDEKASHISEIAKKMIPGGCKTVPSMSRLDVLMLEKVVLSPIKQAVLQTCSLPEFRKMYKNEYQELEQEMRRQNCRMTRQMSQAIRKENEEKSLSSDSSEDEEELPEKDRNSKSGNNSSREKVTDVGAGASGNKSVSLITNYTPNRRSGHKVALSNSVAGKKEKASAKENTTHAKTCRRDILTDMNVSVEESDELNASCNENSEVSTTSADSSQKLPTPSSSQRKFFKTRSPNDNLKRTSFDKGYKLKFVHKTLPVKDSKKMVKDSKNKRDTPKKPAEPFSPKQTQISTSENAQKQPMSPLSGFIFAPGFLSPEKRGSDNLVEDESFDLNRSSCLTYGSPKETVAQLSSGIQSATNSPLSGCSDGTDVPADNWRTSNYAHVSDDNESLSVIGDASHTEEGSQLSSQSKLFPIFGRKSGRSAAANKKQASDTSPSQRSSKLPKDDDNSQMTIDAGQKKVGLTQCNVCNMVYVPADNADRMAHSHFHKKLEVLNFPGWKKERVVQEYPEDLGRVIIVLPDDAKYARKKVEEVNQLMGRELGFPDASTGPLHPYHKVFFYILDKKITGCCVAEPIQEGFRIIPGDLDDSQESGQRPWCCSSVPESTCVGISRLWVAAENRKCGISTKLVDSIRQWFNYGSLIPKHKIAFSDPTPDGRRFAQKYMGSSTFLVYKFSYG